MSDFETVLPPQTPEVKRPRTWTKVTAFAASLAVGTIASVALDMPSVDPASARLNQYPTEPDCLLQPSAADIQAADHILKLAVNKSTEPNSAPYDREKIKHEKEKIAQKYGLTVYNYSDTMGDVETALYSPDVTDRPPYAVIFDQTHDFLAKYGVDLQLATTTVDDGVFKGKGEIIASPPTDAELDDDVAKYDLIQLAQVFSQLPVELVKYSGLKHIILASIKNAGGFAHTYGNHDTIHLNITGLSGLDLDHELTHLINSAECGQHGMWHDSQFTRINGKDDVYKNPGTNISLDAYWSVENVYVKNIPKLNYDNFGWPILPKILAEQMRGLAKHVVVDSDYAFTNEVEDYAETGKYLLDPNSSYYFPMKADFQRPLKKFVLEAARLYDVDPRFLNYLTEYSALTNLNGSMK